MIQKAGWKVAEGLGICSKELAKKANAKAVEAGMKPILTQSCNLTKEGQKLAKKYPSTIAFLNSWGISANPKKLEMLENYKMQLLDKFEKSGDTMDLVKALQIDECLNNNVSNEKGQLPYSECLRLADKIKNGYVSLAKNI